MARRPPRWEPSVCLHAPLGGLTGRAWHARLSLLDRVCTRSLSGATGEHLAGGVGLWLERKPNKEATVKGLRSVPARLLLAFMVLLAVTLLLTPLESGLAAARPEDLRVMPPMPGSPAADLPAIPGPPHGKEGRDLATERPGPATALSVAPSSTGFQTTGSIRSAVIAVDFSDNRATVPLYDYVDMLFDTPGYPNRIAESVRDYYQRVSYWGVGPAGLDVDGEVWGKARSEPAAPVQWARVPRSYTYYTASNYGFGAYPRNAQGLAEDTIKAVDRYVDFSKFTTYDGTQGGVTGAFVLSLQLVHAGPAAEVTGDPNDIWSHAWVLSRPYKTNDKKNGKPVYLYRYITWAEKWPSSSCGLAVVDCVSPMGTAAHEFGHTLGLSDLYGSGNSVGLGDWDMMAFGSWGTSNGNSPSFISAFGRTEAGWVVPTVVTTTAQVVVPPAGTNAVIYRLPTDLPNEYFLVENRQIQPGGYDGSIPGSGMLVYHVDLSRPDNSNASRPKVALEQADGAQDLETGANFGDAGDPYPGATTNTAFTSGSSPSSNNYDGTLSGVSITEIGLAGGSTVIAALSGYGP